MKPQIIFVYNADGDLFNSVTDFVHKIISPSTYACKLCALTYGSFTMKHEWKSFIEYMPFKKIFLHKNEFEKIYKLQTELPAIFIEENNKFEQFISTKEIESCASLQQLKELITSKLSSHVQHNHSHI